MKFSKPTQEVIEQVFEEIKKTIEVIEQESSEDCRSGTKIDLYPSGVTIRQIMDMMERLGYQKEPMDVYGWEATIDVEFNPIPEKTGNKTTIGLRGEFYNGELRIEEY